MRQHNRNVNCILRGTAPTHYPLEDQCDSNASFRFKIKMSGSFQCKVKAVHE